MAQLTIPADGAAHTVAATDTAVIRVDELEQHPLTIAAAGAATVTLADNGGGWYVVTTTATVTISRPA
jgi:hypothetical protein